MQVTGARPARCHHRARRSSVARTASRLGTKRRGDRGRHRRGVGAAMFLRAVVVDRNEMDEWAPLYLGGAAVCTGIGALVGWAIDAANRNRTSGLPRPPGEERKSACSLGIHQDAGSRSRCHCHDRAISIGGTVSSHEVLGVLLVLRADNSISSVLSMTRWLILTVHGLVYAFGSSTVISISRSP